MKNKKYIIGGIVILIAVGVIGFLFFQSSLTYYYSVGEFYGKVNSLTNRTVRVGGEVMPGAQHDVNQSTLTFTIADKTDLSKSLNIVYKGGAIPDAFKEGQDVIVEGKYPGSGTFQATSLITKCPSKYTTATTTASK